MRSPPSPSLLLQTFLHLCRHRPVGPSSGSCRYLCSAFALVPRNHSRQLSFIIPHAAIVLSFAVTVGAVVHHRYHHHHCHNHRHRYRLSRCCLIASHSMILSHSCSCNFRDRFLTRCDPSREFISFQFLSMSSLPPLFLFFFSCFANLTLARVYAQTTRYTVRSKGNTSGKRVSLRTENTSINVSRQLSLRFL